MFRRCSAALAMMCLCAAVLMAHEMTIKGTVAAIDKSRIQIKTGEERKGESPAWFAIDAKTKIVRGDKTVTSIDDAKISVGERIVVNVDHQADGKMKTLEVRLAAK
jgi:hypothetical protein